MTSELKAKWVAALKSGKYQQGRGRLRSLDDRFCCLGVLCEVAGIKAIKTCEGYRYDGSSTGVFSPLINSYDASELIRMNDLELNTFAEIADYIEQHIPTTPEGA